MAFALLDMASKLNLGLDMWVRIVLCSAVLGETDGQPIPAAWNLSFS